MFDSHQIHELLLQHGYLLIFAFIFFSNMGLPVPDESTVLVAGTLAGKGILNYPTVFVVCVTAAILGDNTGYWIGRRGGRKLILRYGKYLRIHEGRIVKFERYFEKHGRKTVFFGRFVAGLRLLAGPLSGAACMPFGRFFICNALGAVVWVFIISQLGFRFGSAIGEQMSRNFRLFIVLGVALIVIYFLYRKWNNRRETARGLH